MLTFFVLSQAVPKVPISVEGVGFFRLMTDGRVVYSRKGQLTVVDGEIRLGDAHALPNLFVPEGTTAIKAQTDGTITAETAKGSVEVGKLVLAIFPQGEVMGSYGSYLTCADTPQLAYPCGPGAGKIGLEPQPEASSKQDPIISKSSGTNTLPAVPKKQIDGTVDPKPVEVDRGHAQTTSNHPKTQPVSPSGSGQVELIVHPKSEVTGSSFTFGDIADITGPEKLVNQVKAAWAGNTPSIGFPKPLDSGILSLRLKGARIDTDLVDIVVPPHAFVELEHQTVTSDALLAQALSAISSLTGGLTQYGPTNSVPDLNIPDGDVKLEASNPMASGNGNYFVTITARLNGTIVGTRPITLAPLAGSISVKSGDPVTVILTAGNATVTVPGIIDGRAYLGQPVKVRITGVGNQPTIQYGILTAANTVQVKL